MFANRLSIYLSLLLAAAAGVSAQTPSQCIITCSTQALANSTCTTVTNFTCLCSSTSFQAAAGACIKANCTTQDQQTALQLQQQECGTSSSSSTAASASSPSSSKSSAAPVVVEQLPFLTAVVAIAGIALGGAFTL